jgi:hypothetical protein
MPIEDIRVVPSNTYSKDLVTTNISSHCAPIRSGFWHAKCIASGDIALGQDGLLTLSKKLSLEVMHGISQVQRVQSHFRSHLEHHELHLP